MNGEKNDKHDRLNYRGEKTNKVSDAESFNHGGLAQNMNNVNLPNTIKYPKGGAITNSSNQNNNNPQISNPNMNSINQNINNQINNNINNNTNKEETPEDSGDGKAKKKISGKFLVGLIVMVILYQYYSYVFWLKPLLAPGEDYFVSRIIILIIFHLLLFMMIWSFIVTMRTIPGFIPLYWGFYIGDEEYKRKRYCLICNAFKPERSHHCSVCNICVLNMDHHCPWVNNCIGFYNRKFFMQLLFYLLVLLLFMDLSCVVEIYEILKHIYTTKFKVDSGKMINYLVVLPAYMICLVLTVLNTMFFKYHLQLVFNNSTTIESLDPENKENSFSFFF